MLNVSLMHAHLGTYLPNFTTAIRDHTNVERVNYVSTSAENGPAMAGLAGPVPAPMCECRSPSKVRRKGFYFSSFSCHEAISYLVCLRQCVSSN